MLDVRETSLKGVKLIQLDAFEDFRGQYVETYNEEEYKNHGIDVHFVQDDISTSSRNVLRGLHGDQNTWKLVSCLHGEFYLVVVCCDKNSADFGKWEAFTLSDKNRLQVLIPPKHGNGHLVLSDSAIFHYKQSTYYNRSGQFTYYWNDPQFSIQWPVEKPVVSKRDDPDIVDEH